MEPFELDVAEYLIRWGIGCGMAVLIVAAIAFRR
jgi:hypothetical protein